MSILSCGRIYFDIQRLSEFAFFNTNKSDKKDKLSHQSLRYHGTPKLTTFLKNTLCHFEIDIIKTYRLQKVSQKKFFSTQSDGYKTVRTINSL